MHWNIPEAWVDSLWGHDVTDYRDNFPERDVACLALFLLNFDEMKGHVQGVPAGPVHNARLEPGAPAGSVPAAQSQEPDSPAVTFLCLVPQGFS